MKRRILTLVLVLCFFGGGTIGCSGIRENLIKLPQENIKNLETSRALAASFLKIWPAKSGAIRGALGDDINKLPIYAKEAMDELDRLSVGKVPEHFKDLIFADQECEEGFDCVQAYKDFKDHYALSTPVRFLSKLVQQALKQFAPEVLDMVGMFAL